MLDWVKCAKRVKLTLNMLGNVLWNISEYGLKMTQTLSPYSFNRFQVISSPKLMSPLVSTLEHRQPSESNKGSKDDQTKWIYYLNITTKVNCLSRQVTCHVTDLCSVSRYSSFKQANQVCVYHIHSVSFTVARLMLNHVVIVEKTSVSTKS